MPTRVGWLTDTPAYLGGAELTMREFEEGRPDGVQLVPCPAGGVVPGLDRYVIGNCVQYTLEDVGAIHSRAVKYWHDVGPHVDPAVRGWLVAHAVEVCCSPVQAAYMGLDNAVCIPPPVDLARFHQAASRVNGDRKGIVSVGSWQNLGKAPHRAREWANGAIDFFGGGPFAPDTSRPVDYEDMPALLASYETFVHLPSVIEPFGRVVAEAWAAGCAIVTNDLVGAKYWITENPDALYTACEDFWKLCLEGVAA